MTLANIEYLVFAGGGGRGLAYQSAIKKAQTYGLDLKKVKGYAGTSVGAISALMVALEHNMEQLGKDIINCPGESFKDYSLSSIWRFLTHFGFCKGQVLEDWLKDFIKEKTELDDPTFDQLYQKTRITLKFYATNLSTGNLQELSFEKTPNAKVAKAIKTSCAIPVIFEPTVTTEGDYLVDGGLLKNYPIDAFDTPCDRFNKEHNKNTLGFFATGKFSLKAQIGKLFARHIEGIINFIFSLVDTVIHREATQMTELDKSRTIFVDCPDEINATTFSMTEETQHQTEDLIGYNIEKFIQESKKKPPIIMSSKSDSRLAQTTPRSLGKSFTQHTFN